MSEALENQPTWVERISLQGKELEENRKYNSNRSIHGEWIHPDRFRYHHEVYENNKIVKYTCGSKYNPDDTSNCPFCQGYKYQRPIEEILDVAHIMFSTFNASHYMALVVSCWEYGKSINLIKNY